MSTLTMDDAVALVDQIANGKHEQVRAGQTLVMPETYTDGDYVAQGDMNIVVCESNKAPKKYKKVPREKMTVRLVPGQDETIGAKHCLASLEGVDMYLPEEWNDASLDGPFLRLKNGATITHPVHGDVVIPACYSAIQIEYQREWDAEQARERRARD